MTKLFVSWGRTPAASCPRCRVTLRSATGINAAKPARPTPGDLTLCDQCVTWLVFGPRLTLRLASAAEIDRLSADSRALALAIVTSSARRETPQ